MSTFQTYSSSLLVIQERRKMVFISVFFFWFVQITRLLFTTPFMYDSLSLFLERIKLLSELNIILRMTLSKPIVIAQKRSEKYRRKTSHSHVIRLSLLLHIPKVSMVASYNKNHVFLGKDNEMGIWFFESKRLFVNCNRIDLF
jgi:hypothetical protein